MKDKKQQVIFYIMYILSLLIFGTNGLYVSNISLQSNQIVFMRTLIGGILLTMIVLLCGGFEKVNIKKDLKNLLFGGTALAFNWIALFEAYKLLNVSLATLIYYVGPVLVLLCSPILFKEQLTKNKYLSVVIVGIGLVCISGSIMIAGSNFIGLLVALLSAIMYASMIIFNKKVMHTNGMQTAAIELNVAFVIVLIYTLLTSGLPQIISNDIPYILGIGVINTGVAYYLYFTSIKKLTSQSVALISYLDPVSALIFSALFLHESMTLMQIIGAFLIIGGALVGEKQ